MNQPIVEEKRQCKRYLCDSFFSDSYVKTEEKEFQITAIDFSKEGMGFFCSDFIPELVDFKLCFRYSKPEFDYSFEELDCVLVHSNITEVGSHFGLVFILSKLSDSDKQALTTIEKILNKQDDPEDRYHLFMEE